MGSESFYQFSGQPLSSAAVSLLVLSSSYQAIRAEAVATTAVPKPLA